MKLLNLSSMGCGDSLASSQLLQARSAIEEGKYEEAEDRYLQAIVALAADPECAGLRTVLYVEHTSLLLARGELERASKAALKYLPAVCASKDLQGEVHLRLLLADSLGARDHWFDCLIQIQQVEERITAVPSLDYGVSTPLLIHLRGLLAAENGDFERAETLVMIAERTYQAGGNLGGAAAVRRDRKRLGLLSRSSDPGGEILNSPEPQSAVWSLLYARAMRLDSQYEEAENVLKRLASRPLEHPLRFAVLHELVLLYRLLSDRYNVQRLRPLLEEAAYFATDPVQAMESVYAVFDNGES
jgi:hypothetical protein